MVESGKKKRQPLFPKLEQTLPEPEQHIVRTSSSEQICLPRIDFLDRCAATMKPEETIMSQIAEVTDCLYLCAARAVKAGRLKELGITCVVNATAELPNLPLEKIDYVKINVDDSPYTNLYSYFDAVADKIDEVRKRGGKTLVHCIAGVSRSASLCLAYLMKYEKMPLKKAYTFLKSRRAVVRPNHGFFRQLIDYEKRLFGQETVSMVHNSAAGMLIPDVYEVEYKTMIWFQKHFNRNLGRH